MTGKPPKSTLQIRSAVEHIRRVMSTRQLRRCRKCDYDLRGTKPGQDAICPECGAPYRDSQYIGDLDENET